MNKENKTLNSIDKKVRELHDSRQFQFLFIVFTRN